MRLLIALLSLVLIGGPVLGAPQTHDLARPDGSSIYYTLDYPEGAPEGLVLIAQGSSCTPGVTTPSIEAVRAGFSDYVALIVEKVGVTPDAPIVDGVTDCPEEFTERYTLSQRVSDYLLVLDHLRTVPDLPIDRLILFGGSEGGLAVTRLAPNVKPAATIVLSSAIQSSFGDMVRATVPPEGHPTIDAGFAAARANPDSSEVFAGSTYRFWADILDQRSLDDMLRADTPILLIQGGLDTMQPIAEARAISDAFAAQGRCNLTYWEFPALDHSMRGPGGSPHLTQVAHLAAGWAEQPLSAC